MARKSIKPGLDLAKVGAEKRGKRLPLPASAQGKNERVRRWIVYLVYIVYGFLLFEGVLRKWALPGMHSILFFVRDPFVLAIYALAIKYKMWPKWSPYLTAGCMIAVGFIPLAGLQTLIGNLPPTITIYGWRNYFFYLPLAFIIGEQLRGRDLARLIRYSCLAAIPIAVLCYQQFRSPPEDALNLSYGGSAAMLVSEGIVRTSGTFTVAAAQTLFIGSVIAMVLTVWILPRRWRPLNKYELLLSSFAILTSFAVSGSRSVILQAAMVGVGAITAIMIIYRNRPRMRMLITLPLLGVIAATLIVTVFHKSYEAILVRQQEAQGVEGNSLLRITQGFTSVIGAFQRESVFGQGLGTGTNGAFALTAGTNQQLIIGEDEWARIILENGILGLVYILYRCWLTYAVGKAAITATRRSRNPLPIILFSFIALTFLNGQISSQGTINGYGWLFIGFCMAANRLGTRKAKDEGLWS